jgi:hypothetical protein
MVRKEHFGSPRCCRRTGDLGCRRCRRHAPKGFFQVVLRRPADLAVGDCEMPQHPFRLSEAHFAQKNCGLFGSYARRGRNRPLTS